MPHTCSVYLNYCCSYENDSNIGNYNIYLIFFITIHTSKFTTMADSMVLFIHFLRVIKPISTFYCKKFVNRLCRTAAATVHWEANSTPFLAAILLSFSCWIRHLSSVAPIERSTTCRILVHASLYARLDAVSRPLLIRGVITFWWRPL